MTQMAETMMIDALKMCAFKENPGTVHSKILLAICSPAGNIFN